MKQIHNFYQTLSWFLSTKSTYLDREGPWVTKMIASNLGYLYKGLPETKFKKESRTLDMPYFGKELLSEDYSYLYPIENLKNHINTELKDFVYDFLVHGSFSTLDYSKGWSDLDTYIILKSETILNPEDLLSFRNSLLEATKYLYKIDPLQHHEFIFSSEFDLDNYLSHCLPLEVLKNSKSLIRNSTYDLQYHRSSSDTLEFLKGKVEFFKNCYEEGAMFHHGLDGVYLLEDFEEKNSMYQMKYFLSVLMSMPAFFLDSIGQPTYKKESFSKARSFFNKNWEVIDAASLVREKWSSKESFPYQGNDIPDWFKEDLKENYFERSHKLAKEMLDISISHL